MVILIDMDDTLENLGVAWINWLNKKYGTEVDWFRDVKEWDLTVPFPTLTPQQIYGALSEEEFWDTVTVKENAPLYVKKLIDDGNDIYVVTASWYTTIRAKMERCLFKYFPFLTWEQVIISSNKQLVQGDIAIDDNPLNLEGRNGLCILFNAPHNLNYDDTESDIVRVDNWQSAYLLIKSYEEMKNKGNEVL